MDMVKLSRREFLTYSGIMGSGLILGCNTTEQAQSKIAQNAINSGLAKSDRLNLFVAIQADGTVEIVSHRVEMGQGSKTGIPQIVAEELEADWQKVKVIQGLGNKAYGNQNTDGSTSIRLFFEKLREMGASARMMLEQAAAQYWQVPIEAVYAKENYIINKNTQAKLAYGDLAELASKQVVPDIKSLKFKAPEQYRLIGKPVPIVDLKEMTMGKANYGVDKTLPNMLIASIERCPVLHGKVSSFNAEKALAVPGVVKVIEMPATRDVVSFFPLAGVAVLATNTWAAMQGRKLLEIQWDLGEKQHINSDQEFETYKNNLNQKPIFVAKKGDVKNGFLSAKTLVEARYKTPYLVHAPMEPPMATAWFHDGICEIWACVQDPQSTMNSAAAMMNLPADMFVVEPTLLGGAFGRKSKPDFSNEAVFLAHKTQQPVKVVWSREDDIQQGYYHAGALENIKAGIDDKGNITTWHQQTVYPTIASTFNNDKHTPQDFELSLGFGDLAYDFDHVLMEKAEAKAPVRIGWMRSVCNIQHAFALNCFLDEIAHKINKPTAEVMLKALGADRNVNHKEEFGFSFTNYSEKLERHPYSTKRYREVLQHLIKQTPIDQTLPNNQGWGIAVHRSFVSYIAVASKVSVVNNKLSVDEIHCVVDCGLAINPDRIKAQMEGAMIFGLSIALMGKIDIKAGQVVQSNFHDYPVTRMPQAPNITVHLLNPTENVPSGVGEPGVPPVAPSICNAIFAATGQRYRDLPLNQYLTV
ncbi:xanthine dehydrogenase family protein molybdopterin-binding subunit [Algibacillus agarilyticus]|uniref:xanthine dehydrogenase family protein molybdopterin-binding subunit n=1 Tax=Algibacillus agarilyticus TaxID=2234133 RepID=UPI000DD0C54C|nr:molybdopterin cofactor-binding domain-containing protein [Algibacillus agarilyticus]